MKNKNQLKQPTIEIAKNYRNLMKEWIFLEEHKEELSKAEHKKRFDAMEKQYRELSEKYFFNFEYFKENGKVGIKDYTGSVVVAAQYDDVCSPAPCENDFPLLTYPMIKEGKIGIVSLWDGHELTPFIYDDFDYTPGSYILKKDERYGMLSESGTMLMDVVAEEAEDEGLVQVFKKGGRYALVYHRGHNDFISTGFDFSEYDTDYYKNHMLAYVLKGTEWGYINKEGKFTLKPYKAEFCLW